MAIYTRMGAPVQILEAEQRTRWYVIFKNGDRKTYDSEPVIPRNRRPEQIEQFDIWWLKAQVIGPYPDGSGRTGEIMEWRTENDFIADDGIRELHAACEALQGTSHVITWGRGPYKGQPLTADPTFRDYLAKRF